MIENEAVTVQWYRDYYTKQGLRPSQWLGLYRHVVCGGGSEHIHGYTPYYNERRIDKRNDLWQIEVNDFTDGRMWINVYGNDLISNWLELPREAHRILPPRR